MAKRWSEDEMYLAMHLYYRTPFGKQHKSHTPIKELAQILDRTPGSVAMRLSNFSSLDPVEKARGIKGLGNCGKSCEEFWEKFHLDFESESIKAEELWETYVLPVNASETEQGSCDNTFYSGTAETLRTVKVRLAQNFFRRAVLETYNQKCAISGTPLKSLLVASHIIPWSVNEELRTKPSNGICLSSIHDTAFDRGLLTLDEEYRVVLSKELKEHTSVEFMKNAFVTFEGDVINLPERNLPEPFALEWHRENIFTA